MKTYEAVILNAAKRMMSSYMSGSNEFNSNSDVIGFIFEIDSDIVYRDIEAKYEEVAAAYRADYKARHGG